MSDIIDINTLFGPLPAAASDLTVDDLMGLMGRHSVKSCCTLSTIGDVLEAARKLIDRGCDAVLVSLGADGALYVDADAASHAEAPIDDAVNTVGAGDALLAGFVAAGGGQAALANATAWSVAAVRSPGTRMCPVTAADRGAVVVHERLDRARRLQA